MRAVETGAIAARAFLSARAAMWNARSTVLTTSVFALFFLASAGPVMVTAMTAASSATTCDRFIAPVPARNGLRTLVPSLAHGVIARCLQVFRSPRPYPAARDVGTRAGRAAPQAGARAPDGGRGAGLPAARQRPPDRARADRAAVRRGQLPRDGRAGGPRHLRGRRADRFPARELRGGPRPDRRPPGGAAGRRLHRARRRRRRGDLAEDGPRRAPGGRAAHAARAARGRHGRRRQREVARDDGPHVHALH